MVEKTYTKEFIFQRILDEQQQLLLYGVKKIGLFGSFVRGDQKPSSDVDIFVEFKAEKHTFDNFMEVVFLLEKRLGRKVELVTPEALSPYLGPHILKEVEIVPIGS